MKTDNQIQEPLNVALYARVSTGRQENEKRLRVNWMKLREKLQKTETLYFHKTFL